MIEYGVVLLHVDPFMQNNATPKTKGKRMLGHEPLRKKNPSIRETPLERDHVNRKRKTPSLDSSHKENKCKGKNLTSQSNIPNNKGQRTDNGRSLADQYGKGVDLSMAP